MATRLGNDRAASHALPGLIDEFESSVKDDVALSRADGRHLLELVKKTRQLLGQPNRLIEHFEAISHFLETRYWALLSSKIIFLCANGNERRNLLALAKSFVSEVEYIGYSRRFVYHHARNFFFSTKHDPPSITDSTAIAAFLSSFSGISRNYSVIFRVSKDFNNYQPLLEPSHIELSDRLPSFASGHDEAAPQRPLHSSQVFAIVSNIQTTTVYGAREIAESRLKNTAELACYDNHADHFRWSRVCLVHDHDSLATISRKQTPNPIECGLLRHNKDICNEPNRLIELASLILRLSPESVSWLRNALKYHRIAARSSASENQLVTLWAALEGLLPAPAPSQSRIGFYAECVVPSVCLSYLYRAFYYLSESLYFSGSHIRDHVRSKVNSDSFFKSCVLLISTSTHEKHRRELYALLDDNPLLRYRIFELHERTKSATRVLDSLNTYKKRIEWHLRRIYNVRSQIVHTAQSLPYTDTLVENLHSYFDICLRFFACAIRSRSRMASSIGSIVADASTMLESHTHYLKTLSTESPSLVDAESCYPVIFGDHNPLPNDHSPH
ncbi:MAG: hypothetical protein JNM86_02595 [Phycisphaerae bacterium]|nr:hypothetical protein [Phycisphaerae bacterium]